MTNPAWFKKGSGTVAGTAHWVLRTTVPDPFLNHATNLFPPTCSNGHVATGSCRMEIRVRCACRTNVSNLDWVAAGGWTKLLEKTILVEVDRLSPWGTA